MRSLKGSRLKKVIKDDSESIYIVQDHYNPGTGELVVNENRFDPSLLQDRVARMRDEITRLEELDQKVKNGNFDEVVDKRTVPQKEVT